MDGADHQHVPAPVCAILRGTTRTARCARWWRPSPKSASRPADFRDFSLTVFLGLLAYDWLRVLIWFDHMGLRVATLVNLSFIGGDRARRGGGAISRPWRAHPRHPRRHPPFRHLGAAAHSLLHPARRGMGQGLDRRGGARQGRADARRGQGARRSSMRVAGAAIARGGASSSPPARAKPARAAGPADGAPAALERAAARLRLQQRRRRRRSPARRTRRGATSWPTSAAALRSISSAVRSTRCKSRGHFFYLSEEGRAPWSIGYEPARRAGDYRVEPHRLQSPRRSPIRSKACARRWMFRRTPKARS